MCRYDDIVLKTYTYLLPIIAVCRYNDIILKTYTYLLPSIPVETGDGSLLVLLRPYAYKLPDRNVTRPFEVLMFTMCFG